MMGTLVTSWTATRRCHPGRAPGPRDRRRAVASLLALALGLASPARGGEDVHRLRSPRQGGATTVRVFTPDQPGPEGVQTILYVLPVEAGEGSEWGDPADEVRRTGLAARHGLVVAIPTFYDLPWYADHPSDPHLQQESYILNDVLPLVERLHAADPGSPRRLLVGFSKSGWGAWTLLLRHPDLFSKAAAWDAPVMQQTPDRFGMGPIFGDLENFERYRISRLVLDRADLLRRESRLILTGYFKSFRTHHTEMHELLSGLGIPHIYRDGPMRNHNWHSGWLAESVALLLER